MQGTICPNGHDVGIGQAFCGNCGIALTYSPDNGDTKKRVLAGIGLGILLGGSAYLAFLRLGNQQDEATTNTAVGQVVAMESVETSDAVEPVRSRDKVVGTVTVPADTQTVSVATTVTVPTEEKVTVIEPHSVKETVTVIESRSVKETVTEAKPLPITGTEMYVSERAGERAGLRSGPGSNQKLIGELPVGTAVTVIGKSKGWSDELGKNVDWSEVTIGGWIRSDLLTTSGANQSASQSTSRTMYTTQEVSLRSDAGSNYKLIKKIPSGTKVTVTGTKQGWSDELGKNVSWSRVTAGGWIRSDYLSADNAKASSCPDWIWRDGVLSGRVLDVKGCTYEQSWDISWDGPYDGPYVPQEGDFTHGSGYYAKLCKAPLVWSLDVAECR